MKRVSVYRLALIMHLVQITISAHAQNAFERSYDNDSTHDAAFSVIQTMEGGYICGGNSFNPSIGYSPIFIVKTDCKGDTIWTKTFKISTTGGDQLMSILEMEDGSYILV